MFKYGYIKAYSLYTSICLIYFIFLWCELMTLNNISHHRYIAVYLDIYGPYIYIIVSHQTYTLFYHYTKAYSLYTSIYVLYIIYLWCELITYNKKPDSFLSGFQVYNSITSSFLMAFSFTAAIMASLLSACSILIRSSTFW